MIDTQKKPSPGVLALAHTYALREDAWRSSIRKIKAEQPELITSFIAAVLLDEGFAVEMAEVARAILRRRERFAQTHAEPSQLSP